MLEISERLQKKINAIPTKPGIYQMKDCYGNIIYIGKSKSLRTRVKSYFNKENKWNKINQMVFHIDDINFIVTDTHLEAQLLECALIKKFQPIYNTQFKNHNKYKYLKVERKLSGKPLSIVDEMEDDCFGPYRSKNPLIQIVNFFQNIYPIKKHGHIYTFKYKILPNPTNHDNFKENRRCLMEILSNETCMLIFLEILENMMQSAALEYKYEMASIYRDALGSLKYIYASHKKEASELMKKEILVGERIQEGYKLFYISEANIILKKKFREITKEAVERFLIEGQSLEKVALPVVNEKRLLDFKSIIYTEIQDKGSKAILNLDSNDSIDKFIHRLIRINN